MMNTSQHNTMLRLLIGTACVAVFAACAVDLPVEGDNGYSCATDADCVSGFFCSNLDQPEGAVGRCVREGTTDLECRDLDRDGAFVGAGCATGRPLDCDDTNNAIGPNAQEVCDGVDNNCNGEVDEDLPTRPCPLQSGLCSGAERACVDGAYQDCATDNLYGEGFEATEVSCDQIDNDCDNAVDENCDCSPQEEEARACDLSIGICNRGVQLCLPDGSLSECIVAPTERTCSNGFPCTSNDDCAEGDTCGDQTCETSDDCDPGGICVNEIRDNREDLYDDCISGSTVGCEFSVCRYPMPGDDCTSDDDCGGNLCVGGQCHMPTQGPQAEVCNGIDDNCNGSIDDDFNRYDVCEACPFNSVYHVMNSLTGTQRYMCVDRYEASRIDATDSAQGESELYAVSMPNVIPWTGLEIEDAQLACTGQELSTLLGATRTPVPPKTLCQSFEFAQLCGGQFDTAEDVDFPYSRDRTNDVFIPGACNDGHAAVGLQPTGSAANCCTPLGVCDAVGNVAEYVRSATVAQIAGGSYNDTDEAVLQCGDGRTYQPIPADAATRDDIGFRCCIAPKIP